MRPEYRREDLGKGVRGKYHKAFNEGASFIVDGSKTSVDIDAVRMMREIRDEISREIQDMSFEEEKRYIGQQLKTATLFGNVKKT